MEHFKALRYTKEASIETGVTTGHTLKVTETVCCPLNKLGAEFKMPYLSNGKHCEGDSDTA
jgi:hypothetical protein